MSIIGDIIGGVVGKGAGAVLADLRERRRDAKLEALGHERGRLEALRRERKIMRQSKEIDRDVQAKSLRDTALELTSDPRLSDD